MVAQPRSVRFAGVPVSTNWPAGTRPEQSHVFTHNEIAVAACPQRVWGWLVNAGLWPRWYHNAWHVTLPGDRMSLEPDMVFQWTTLGARITCKVVEYDPPRRIGWMWWRLGARGYHGWLLKSDSNGTRVITEETQQGFFPWLLKPMLQGALSFAHWYWLRQLARQATQRLPRP